MLTMTELRKKYEVKVEGVRKNLLIRRHDVFLFPNGRGASVVDGDLHSYSFYSEIAVLKISSKKGIIKTITFFDAKKKIGKPYRVKKVKVPRHYLDFTTSLGNDVIVVQNEAEELDILNKIYNLPKRHFLYFTRSNPHGIGEQVSGFFAKIGNYFKVER